MDEKTLDTRQSLDELYRLTDDLMRKYRRCEDDVIKGFYLREVQELSKDLAMYNCRKFIADHRTFDIAVQDLYDEVAMGTAFLEAIKRWDENSGVYFLTYWQLQQYGAFCNVIAKLSAQKRAKFGKPLSLNRSICGESDDTFLDLLESETSTPEEIILAKDNSLLALLEEFVKTDKYGRLIEREIMERKAKNAFTSEFFGVKKSGARERQIAERTRKRFKKFCEERGFDVIRYLENK